VTEPDALDLYLDRLSKDLAGAKRERLERARQFWATHARSAAAELVKLERSIPHVNEADLFAAGVRLDVCRRALHEAAGRGGLDSAGLLAEVREDAARKAAEAAAANVAQETADLVEQGKEQV